MKQNYVRQVGRDARNGRFIAVAAARRRKVSAVVERIRYPRRKTRLTKKG